MTQEGPKGVAEVDEVSIALAREAREIEAIAERVRQHILANPKLHPRRGHYGESYGTLESRFARRLITERRQRDAMLGSALFGEPAWDMLLDLFAAHEEGQQISVSSLCIASAVPATTALRCISAMTARGLVVRRPDPADRRRIWIELAHGTLVEMRELMQSWMKGSDD